jgi:hypothetical protein
LTTGSYVPADPSVSFEELTMSLPTRRTIRLAAVLAVAALATSCGSDGDPDASPTTAPAAGAEVPVTGDEPAEAGPLELAFADGSTLTIAAPGGATATPFQDGVEVAAGTGFQLEVYPGVGSTTAYKEELATNDLNVVQGFLVDELDQLLWSSELGGVEEFHLYAIIGEGDGYTCADTRGPVYTEDQARAMLEACVTATAS